MRTDIFRFFLAGDVFGAVGMRCATTLLPEFIQTARIDAVVMNAENATFGIGLSPEDAEKLFLAGVDVVTGGNHTFEKRDFWPVLESRVQILRPANFPEGTPGRGFGIFEKNGFRFGVINLLGREDMYPMDCPFRRADAVLESWKDEAAPFPAIVDFHAESNREKEAMGLYLDGRAAAVVGTHTHVQTADERIFAGGTAYMTDLGMTGADDSVIGVDPENAVKRNLSQVLYKLEPRDGPGSLRGLVVDYDPVSGRAVRVERIALREKQ